jgi:hypothetical protein
MTALTSRSPGPAAEDRARAPYHLTPEQVRFYDDNGYLVLKDWITGNLLRRLQEAGRRWIDQGKHVDPADPDFADYRFADRPQGRTMWRVDYLHNKGQSASLELLGSPQVLGVAESLCGPNFTPTYEAMVFKQEGDGAAVLWHQDAVHARQYRIFNYDLYLDASRAGSGALRVIPRTQTQRADVCRLTEEHGWNPPGVIQVEMEPGDVLLHDVMVVHGSEEVTGNPLRRTIYYEFRPAEEILLDGPWDREWIERRMRLIPLALRAYAAAFPGAPGFRWQVAGRFRPAPAASAAEELKIAHLVHMNGAYCSATSGARSAATSATIRATSSADTGAGAGAAERAAAGGEAPTARR